MYIVCSHMLQKISGKFKFQCKSTDRDGVITYNPSHQGVLIEWIFILSEKKVLSHFGAVGFTENVLPLVLLVLWKMFSLWCCWFYGKCHHFSIVGFKKKCSHSTAVGFMENVLTLLYLV